jgi:hypothetical protein
MPAIGISAMPKVAGMARSYVREGSWYTTINVELLTKWNS